MRPLSIPTLILALGLLYQPAEAQQPQGAGASDSEVWLQSLITDSPQQGFELAVMLARRGVRETQPDVEVLRDLRTAYANDPQSLISVSQVIAIHFQTIAAANGYWQSSGQAGQVAQPPRSGRTGQTNGP